MRPRPDKTWHMKYQGTTAQVLAGSSINYHVRHDSPRQRIDLVQPIERTELRYPYVSRQVLAYYKGLSHFNHAVIMNSKLVLPPVGEVRSGYDPVILHGSNKLVDV